jgi:hypothetical protein
LQAHDGRFLTANEGSADVGLAEHCMEHELFQVMSPSSPDTIPAVLGSKVWVDEARFMTFQQCFLQGLNFCESYNKL